jgi:hypothetical protein
VLSESWSGTFPVDWLTLNRFCLLVRSDGRWRHGVQGEPVTGIDSWTFRNTATILVSHSWCVGRAHDRDFVKS